MAVVYSNGQVAEVPGSNDADAMAVSFKELKELGRAKEGSLAQTPFPVVLQAMFLAERTAVVELRQRNLVKRVCLEEGVPVDCESNLLHETPGKFLVERKKLDEAQYQKALQESAVSGERVEQVLLRLGLIQAFDLFKLLQQNLAFKILDCFCANWADARFKVLGEAPEVAQPLRVNLPQLIFTGISTFSAFAEVEQAVAALGAEPLALVPKPIHSPTQLKTNAKDTRLLQELKRGASPEELVAKTGLEREDVYRKLYALQVLGYLDTLESVATQLTSEPAAAAPAPKAELPVVLAADVAAWPSAEEIDQARNEVTSAYLTYRTRDSLDLMGLPEDTTPAAVRESYLAWSERFAPWKFREGELAALGEKARDLFLAGARAYAELTNPETRSQVLKRRVVAREATQRKRSTDFTIKTNLLDAPTQHAEGLRRMEQGEFAQAIALLEFAADCDPRKALYRVDLAWARFKDSPQMAERKSLADLDEAFRIDPHCGEALYFAGEIHHWAHRLDRADDFLRRASKLMPGDRRPVEALKQVGAEKAKVKA